MSSSERIPLMKRSILWLVILIMIAGATYIYEKKIYLATDLKPLPFLLMARSYPFIALTLTNPYGCAVFDAAWGK